MKNLFLLLLTVLYTFQVNAQCVETATDFGHNTNIPTYNITGGVNITLNSDGKSVTINLDSDFMTAAGPDVRVYLVNSDGMSNEALASTSVTSLENIFLGLIEGNGEMEFTANIPNGTDIQNFDTVFFYCLQFSQFWDFGKYTPFSPSNCSVLGTETNTLQNTASIYPNPVGSNKSINITGVTAEISEIRIFDTLGKQVFQQKGNANQKINIPHLNAGLYLVLLNSENQTATKKLVVR